MYNKKKSSSAITLQNYLQNFKISEHKLTKFLCKNKNVIILWLQNLTPDQLYPIQSTIIKLSFVFEDCYIQLKSLLIKLLKNNDPKQEIIIKDLIYKKNIDYNNDNEFDVYHKDCNQLTLNEYLLMNYMLYMNYPCQVFIDYSSNNSFETMHLLKYWNGFAKLKNYPKLLSVQNTDIIYCNDNYNVEIDYFLNSAKNNIFCAISSSSDNCEDFDDNDNNTTTTTNQQNYKKKNKINILALEMENHGVDFDTFFTTAKYQANLQNNWLQIIYQLLFALFHAKFYYQFKHEDLHCKNILIKYYDRPLILKYVNPQLNFNWTCKTNYLLTIIDYEYSKMNNPLLVDVEKINTCFLQTNATNNNQSLFLKVSEFSWKLAEQFKFNLIDVDLITFFTWSKSYKVKFETNENEVLYQDFLGLINYYTDKFVDFRKILTHDIFVKNKIVNFFYSFYSSSPSSLSLLLEEEEEILLSLFNKIFLSYNI